jgi:hypothetical protein
MQYLLHVFLLTIIANVISAQQFNFTGDFTIASSYQLASSQIYNCLPSSTVPIQITQNSTGMMSVYIPFTNTTNLDCIAQNYTSPLMLIENNTQYDYNGVSVGDCNMMYFPNNNSILMMLGKNNYAWILQSSNTTTAAVSSTS